jgi:hypothetical protein
MSNSYVDATAVGTVFCTQADFDRLEKALELPKNSDEAHGFKIELILEGEHPELYMWAEDSCNEGDIPDAAIGIIGEILTKASQEFWEIGLGYSADKHSEGAYGGHSFRFYHTGILVHPTVTWEPFITTPLPPPPNVLLS